MKIHCSPINQVIYQFLPQYGHLSLIHVRLQKLEAFDHSMGWAFHSPFLFFYGSSMTSLNLSIHHRTNKITTWSKTFLFLFFLWIYLHLNFSNKLAVLNKGGHIYDHSPFCEHDISLTFWIPIQALIILIMKHKHQSLSTYPRYPLHNRLGALRSLFGFTNNIPARPCWNLIKKERGWLFWDL